MGSVFSAGRDRAKDRHLAFLAHVGQDDHHHISSLSTIAPAQPAIGSRPSRQPAR
jgi:hypothetical protein